MLIRKISIGVDLKNSMTYVVGQLVLGDSYKIHDITKDSLGDVDVYVRNMESGEILHWKSFNRNLPISIECDIDF